MGKQTKETPDGAVTNEERQMEPLNPDSQENAHLPDPDQTAYGTESDLDEQQLPLDEKSPAREHSVGPDHAEPTDVTGTSNDDYIDGKLIDVGGGD